MTTLADMTLEDLKKLINETVDERLTQLLGEFAFVEFDMEDDEPEDTRTWEEVKADIEKHRITPPPGAPSVLQLLREDRDR